MVLIYGKDTCPYTTAARQDYEKKGLAFTYINVVADPGKLPEMLKHSRGKRNVPVIVDGTKVEVGFGGRS